MRDHRSLHAWQEARGVVLNIAEGCAYGISRSFSRHLNIAYGSAVEAGELLEIALDADIVDRKTAIHLIRRNRRSQRLLLGLMKSVRSEPAHRSRSS